MAYYSPITAGHTTRLTSSDLSSHIMVQDEFIRGANNFNIVSFAKIPSYLQGFIWLTVLKSSFYFTL